MAAAKKCWRGGPGKRKHPCKSYIILSKVAKLPDKAALEKYADGEQFHRDVIAEIFGRLKDLYFGTDIAGRSAHKYNLQAIRSYRCELKVRGMRGWRGRATGLRKKAIRCPWKAGEARGQKPRDFSEASMAGILAAALCPPQRKALAKSSWGACGHSCAGAASELISLEPSLKEQIAQEKRVEALEEKAKASGSKKKRSREPSGSTSSSNSSGAPECPICGRRHRGEIGRAHV